MAPADQRPDSDPQQTHHIEQEPPLEEELSLRFREIFEKYKAKMLRKPMATALRADMKADRALLKDGEDFYVQLEPAEMTPLYYLARVKLGEEAIYINFKDDSSSPSTPQVMVIPFQNILHISKQPRSYGDHDTQGDRNCQYVQALTVAFEDLGGSIFNSRTAKDANDPTQLVGQVNLNPCDKDQWERWSRGLYDA